jgi:hypothetical protein
MWTVAISFKLQFPRNPDEKGVSKYDKLLPKSEFELYMYA